MSEKIKMSIEHKRSQICDIEIDIDDMVQIAYPLFGIEHKIGYWDCPTSPIGLCMYNEFEDRALDGCLFCHQPHERK